MALLNRLAGIPEPGYEENPRKLAVSTFWSCLYELAQGKLTQQQIVNYFALDAGEQAELTWLIGRYNAQPNATAKSRFVELMHVIFMLAEAHVPGYTTNADIEARINAI